MTEDVTGHETDSDKIEKSRPSGTQDDLEVLENDLPPEEEDVQDGTLLLKMWEPLRWFLSDRDQDRHAGELTLDPDLEVPREAPDEKATEKDLDLDPEKEVREEEDETASERGSKTDLDLHYPTSRPSINSIICLRNAKYVRLYEQRT